MAIEQYVGITAGILTGASLVPQLTKVIKERNAESTSVGMLLCLLAGQSLWVWYGILKEDYPVILTNAFSLLVNCTILVLRFVFNGKS